jgi:hypothetical protein
MHGAETDAICTHLLMEEYRKLIKDAPQQPPIYPTADTKAERQGKPISVPAEPVKVLPRLRGQRNS